MKKKILITGCGGYLGSYLMPYLHNKGYEVSGQDIGFFKDCSLYKNEQIEKLIQYKDSNDLVPSDIKNFDVLIHLSGISNDPLNQLTSEKVYDPTRSYTLRIAKICREFNVKFIFASSCSVYGASTTTNYLDENSNTNPQTGYSLNKLQIEQDLNSIASENFFPICLRFATIFGVSSRMRFDVVINMLTGMALTEKKIKLNSDGQAWRPNLYIEDACKAIEHAINYEKRIDDNKILILNVGRDDNNIKIIDIAQIIKKLLPGTSVQFISKTNQDSSNQLFLDRKIKEGKDSRTYKVLFNNFEKKFGKICFYNIEQGVEKMIEDLTKINFEKNIFRNKKFYRLQYLENLYDKKLINENLKWIN